MSVSVLGEDLVPEPPLQAEAAGQGEGDDWERAEQQPQAGGSPRPGEGWQAVLILWQPGCRPVRCSASYDSLEYCPSKKVVTSNDWCMATFIYFLQQQLWPFVIDNIE